MSFYDSNNLIKSRKSEETAENAILWTYELLLLRELKGEDVEEEKGQFLDALLEMEIKRGLFHQNPAYSFDGDLQNRLMSHDQLTAITSASYRYGWRFHEEVWKEIKRQKLRYDNYRPDNPERWLHPRDLIYYGILADSKIARLFVPILALICLISCLSKRRETSGKILAWVRFQTLKKKSLTMRLASKVADFIIYLIHGSWADVFSIYFSSEGHLIQEKAKQVYKE